MGQTLAEVEEIFGQSGTAVPNTDDPSSGAEYVWENSSDSKATCVFADGKLVKKSAKNLP